MAKNFYRAAETIWKESTKDGWTELTPAVRDAFREKMAPAADKIPSEISGLRELLELLWARAKAHAR